jgi:tetratricopeptide (TPR) repeat protein
MRISRPILIATVVSMLVNAVAFGQTVQKKKPRSRSTASAATDKTRARRIVNTTDTAPASQTSEVQPKTAAETAPQSSTPASPNGSVSNSDAKPAEKPAEKTSETPSQTTSAETAPATVSDPMMALRDEIDAAATPQERIRLQLKLADMLLANGKRTEAVAELRSITTVEVFDPQGFYNTGNALARLGDTDEAVNAYKKAIEQRKGRYSRALNNLGVVLMRVGRWDESQDAFLDALKVEGFRYAEASYNLGRLYASRGQTDLAVREWRRALAVDPEHKAAAQFLANAGTHDRITVETPTPPKTVARNSNNRTVTSPVTPPAAPEKPAKTKAAPSTISTKPLALDPVSFGFLQKARSASERGNPLEAIANYQRVISRQSGYFAPANLEMSYLLIGLRRNDEALANLLQVANRDGSRYPISHFHLARLYEIKGELKLAETSYAHTVAAYSQNSQFLLDLSRVREKLGDLKGALEAMEQFLVLIKSDGQDLVWPEERVAALRQKIATSPK